MSQLVSFPSDILRLIIEKCAPGYSLLIPDLSILYHGPITSNERKLVWKTALALRGVCRHLRQLITTPNYISAEITFTLIRLATPSPCPENDDGDPPCVSPVHYFRDEDAAKKFLLRIRQYDQTFGGALKYVSTLDVSYVPMDTEILTCLVELCPNVRKFQCASLCSDRTRNPAAISLAPINNWKSLTSLDLSATHSSSFSSRTIQWCTITPHMKQVRFAGTRQLALFLQSAKSTVPLSLEVLEAPCFQILTRFPGRIEGDTAHLLSFLSRCPSLRSVDLSGWFPDDAEPILAVLQNHCTNLKHLRLRRCSFSTAAQKTLHELRSRLELLDVDGIALAAVPPDCPLTYTVTLSALSKRFLSWYAQFSTRPDLLFKDKSGIQPATVAPSAKLVQAIGQPLADFLLTVTQVRFLYCFADSDPKEQFDTQSRGGTFMPRKFTVKSLPRFVPEWDSTSRIRGFCFDEHVPEGIGHLVQHEPTKSWFVTWECSSSSTVWTHRFMTVEEYLIEGMKAGFTWYWPVCNENYWLLAKLLFSERGLLLCIPIPRMRRLKRNLAKE